MAYGTITLLLAMAFCVFDNSESQSSNSFFKEPTCSKYHFEEQVLAKVIRVEITTDLAMQKIDGDITNTKEKLAGLNDDLDALKNESKENNERVASEVADVKEELSNLKTTSEEDIVRVGSDASNLKEELSNLKTTSEEEIVRVGSDVSNLKEELSNLKTTSEEEIVRVSTMVLSSKEDIARLKNEISSLKDELASKASMTTDCPTKAEFEKAEANLRELMSYHASSVVFVARSPPTSLPDVGNTIIFSTAVLNTGSAYDTSTGAFTAPVSGAYLFSTQLCSVNHIHFQLVINDKVLGVSYQYDKDTDGICSSMVTVATMKSGQQAVVKTSGGGAIVSPDSITVRWNMFTGVLITQTRD